MALFLVASLAGCSAIQHDEAGVVDDRPPLLRSLDGHWRMKGDVRGEPVAYDLEVAPMLHATFSELHMKDVQVPSTYEARVFIGYDKTGDSVIAHWMDSFGARYSIPHGTGRIADNLIEFTIPYPDGAFHDTLTFDPGNRTWSFVLEARRPDGSWQHFARYELTREGSS